MSVTRLSIITAVLLVAQAAMAKEPVRQPAELLWEFDTGG